LQAGQGLPWYSTQPIRAGRKLQGINPRDGGVTGHRSCADRRAGEAKEKVGHAKDKVEEAIEKVEHKVGEVIEKAK
jgi:hypothetical protein